jgi:hypothetical protein
MQAIGFNKRYGLQQAVFNRTKLMTRRLEKGLKHLEGLKDDEFCFIKALGKTEVQIYDDSTKRPKIIVPRYKIGEVVAIKQSYGEVYDELFGDVALISDRTIELHCKYILMETQKSEIKGWTNKMFILPELMMHHIRITDIKLERLQDISDEDCLKEGIELFRDRYAVDDTVRKVLTVCNTPREAFAILINKTCGRGTWIRNPFVFAYSFKFID